MSEPVTSGDPRLVAAVRLLISDIRRSVSPAVAEARFFQSWDGIRADGVESPAERCRRENEEALRLMASLGNARGAPLKAAQRAYPHDPSSHYRVAQRFRRLLREHK
jgi:hypothetical protein